MPKQSDSPDVVQTMRELVATPSVFPHEQLVAVYIEGVLTRLGFQVERIPAEPGRNNLVATYGTAKRYLCFYGHMDTVPADPLWRQDPFTVTVDGDIARGLGVADMKGGIAAILSVAQYATTQQLPLKLAFGVDEENISLGSHVLVQSEFFSDVSMIVSAESGQIFDEHQDFSMNFGRKGRVVIEARITGQTAHAARSDQAINALTQAAALVTQLSALKLKPHRTLGATELIPFFIESSTDAFSIPAHAVVRFNVLTVPGVTSELVIEHMRTVSERLSIAAEFLLLARATPYMEAYEVELDHPVIRGIQDAVFAKYRTTPTYAISVADQNRFAHALGIPVISLGPIGGGDHTADEWVSLRSLRKTVAVYEHLLRYMNTHHKV